MRKIIAGGIAVAVLSSCGAPSYDTPEQALLDNQKQVVEKLEKVSDLTPAQANSTGMMDMQIESSDLNLSMDMAYNFDVNQDTNDTKGNMNISIDGNVAEDMGLPVSEFAGKLDFDLITLTNKVFFKLNTLDISKPSNDPSILMLTSYVTPYLEKWYFMEDTLTTTSNANLVTFQKDLLETLKTQRLFNHVSTNENENFYDYNVELNSDTILNIVKQINDTSLTQEENQLTEEDFTYISEDIAQLNQEVEMNIRISKEDPEYFIFTVNDENATFTIENNDTNIDLQLVDSTVDMTFDFVGTKKINGISAQITAKEGNEEVFAGIMDLTTNGTDTNMQLEANVNSLGETMKLTMNLDDTTTAQSLEITQPDDARDFQEIITQIMMQMMGGEIDMESDIEVEEYDMNLPKDDMIDNSNFSIQKNNGDALMYSKDQVVVTDLTILKNAIEQSYKNDGEFPSKSNFNEKVSRYLIEIPKDPKRGLTVYGCKFGYYYEVSKDLQKYKISNCISSNLEEDRNNGKLEYGYVIENDEKNGFYINE